MRTRTGLVAALAAAGLVLACPGLAKPSAAAEIQVFQESSPGKDDFAEHLLGQVVPFVTNKSAAQLYDYRGKRYQGGIELSRDRSHLFFAETAEGLVLVVIHDDGANRNLGGRAGLSIEVQGSSPGVLVEDDPGRGRDRYLVDGGRITLQNSWINGYTDGAVIGPFDGDIVTVDVMFAANDARQPAIKGLESWAVLTFDSGQSSIDLVLELERRARFVILRTSLTPSTR